MLVIKDNNELFFSRIPRTASRHVGYILTANNFEIKIKDFSDYANLYGDENLSNMPPLAFSHLDINTIKKLFKLPKNCFAVIRNPVDRFKSALFNDNHFFMVQKKLNDLESYERLCDIIEKDLIKFRLFFARQLEKEQTKFIMKPIALNDLTHNGLKGLYNNWFLEQEKFIDDSFKLWKFEKGFEKEFYHWFNQCFNQDLNINIKPLNYLDHSFTNYDIRVNYKLSNKARSNIERYYAKDMELWESLK